MIHPKLSPDHATHWLKCECCRLCDRQKIKCLPTANTAGKMVRILVFGERCAKHRKLVIYEQHVPRDQVVEI